MAEGTSQRLSIKRSSSNSLEKTEVRAGTLLMRKMVRSRVDFKSFWGALYTIAANTFLHVFKDKKQRKPHLEIPLHGATVTEVHDNTGQSRSLIKIEHQSLSTPVLLTTKSPLEFELWFQALAAPGVLESAQKSQHNACPLKTRPELEADLAATGTQFVPSSLGEVSLELESDSSAHETWNWIKGRFIGRGSCGEVYEAEVNSYFHCAVKIIKLPVDPSSDGSLQQRENASRVLEGERILCHLRHRNIVKFLRLELMTDTWEVALFTELLDGQSLHCYINGKSMSDENLLRSFAKQICSALDYIHGLNPIVLHRDVNPCNIMVLLQTNPQIVKLIDFGLSMLLRESATHHSTESVTPKGTSQYMSPELLAPPEAQCVQYSAESDIWAFGCTVYYMACGMAPHAGCQSMLSIAQRLNELGAPPLSAECGASDQLRDFYHRCTTWQRRERWSARQLLDHPFLKQ